MLSARIGRISTRLLRAVVNWITDCGDVDTITGTQTHIPSNAVRGIITRLYRIMGICRTTQSQKPFSQDQRMSKLTKTGQIIRVQNDWQEMEMAGTIH